AAVQAAARLERHAESGRAQAGGEAGAGVFLELHGPLLDGLAIPGSQAEVALHGDDAGARLAHRAGAAKDVDVVAGRLLDDLQPPPLLANQLAHEGERAAVQEAAAQGDRGAVGYQRGERLQGYLLVLAIESGTHDVSLRDRRRCGPA